MRHKYRKSAVSTLLCIALIFTQMMPQMIGFAETGGGYFGQYPER